jgi:3',5'-cyclic-AMP phosphodiesterase
VAKIIILSDLHIVPEGHRIIGIDPSVRLASAINHIERHNSDADLVVVTGDLTHGGDRGSYLRLKATLAALRLPHVLLIGNHDDRATFREIFPDALRDANGFVQGVQHLDGASLVFLDTVKTEPRVGAYHAGAYCAARCAWLDRTLQDAGTRPVYLFMHHPPHKTGFAGMDKIRLEDDERFYEVVRRHRHVRHIFCGHIHRTISGSHHGIGYSIFKSPVHQQPLAFDSLDDSLSIAEPAAYGIVFTHADGVQVHTEDFELSSMLPAV